MDSAPTRKNTDKMTVFHIPAAFSRGSKNSRHAADTTCKAVLKNRVNITMFFRCSDEGEKMKGVRTAPAAKFWKDLDP